MNREGAAQLNQAIPCRIYTIWSGKVCPSHQLRQMRAVYKNNP